MSIRSATRQELEDVSVPALQIVPRLETTGGFGAGRHAASARDRRRWLAALLLLAALVAIAAAVVLIARQSQSAGVVAPSPRATRARERKEAHLGRAGIHAAAQAVTRAATAMGVSASAPTQPAVQTHLLSSTDLTSLTDGAGIYQPTSYMASVYRTAAAPYHIAWRVLAALEYIDGGYADAVAGASAKSELALAARVQAAGHSVLYPHVLALATAAAARPSSGLALDARRLAADGTRDDPAKGATTFLADSASAQGGAVAQAYAAAHADVSTADTSALSDVSAQAVLTLAQSIDPAATAGSAPLAKVSAMLDEARLLNGLPYVWGGGHTEPAWVVSTGYDCSGFVSEVLHAAGYLTAPDTTQTLPGSAGIAKGPGKYVTIYDRTIATLRVWRKKKKIVKIKQAVNPSSAGVHVDRGRSAHSLDAVTIRLPKWVGEWKTIKVTKLVPSLDTTNNDEHVIIDIDGNWWESGGSSADGGAEMVHRIANPSRAYLKSFDKTLHPEGL